MTDYPWLETARASLSRALANGRLGHAPMLAGAPGVGKRALADWLLARMLCLQPAGEQACGECKACRLRAAGSHPDLFRLTPEQDKQEIVVDQVRAFIQSLSLTPTIGTRRVGLIQPADCLNRNAANALLKTLEEPSDEVFLVLVVDHVDRLPVTVVSRCQRYPIAGGGEPALAWLAARHPDQAPAELRRALRLADGAPLLAEAWIDGDGLDFGLAIRDALAGLLNDADRGAADIDSQALARAWSAHPEAAWGWLGRWCRQWMEASLGGRGADLQGLPVPNASDAAERLRRCWDQALEGARLAARPVRHDWLMNAWLAEWRRLSGAESGRI